MKKISLIFIILIAFSCTACSVEYNLEIKEYNYDENLYITESFENYYKNGMTVEKALNYHKHLIDMENDQPTEIEYYKLSPYYELFNSGAHLSSDSRFFHEFALPIYKCYDKYTFSNDNGIITLETEGKFLCPEYLQLADDITLNIYSDYELIETNANSADNGKYTWNLKDNIDKNILLKLSVKNSQDTNVPKSQPFNWELLTIIFACIFILVFIAIGVIIYIKRRENRI